LLHCCDEGKRWLTIGISAFAELAVSTLSSAKFRGKTQEVLSTRVGIASSLANPRYAGRSVVFTSFPVNRQSHEAATPMGYPQK